MTGAFWAPVIGVISAAIGSSLTFIAQRKGQRVQLHQQRAVQYEARRAERLAHLVQFFEVAQEGERVAVERLRAITLAKMRGSGGCDPAVAGRNGGTGARIQDPEIMQELDWLHFDPAHDAEWRERADNIQDRLWVAQKTLHMLCSPALTSAARIFAYSIHNLLWHGPGTKSVPDYLRPTRNAFLDAAREDLGEYP